MDNLFVLMRNGTDEEYGSPIEVPVFTGTKEAINATLNTLKAAMLKDGKKPEFIDGQFWVVPANVRTEPPELNLYSLRGTFKITSFSDENGNYKPQLQLSTKVSFNQASDVRCIEDCPPIIHEKNIRMGKLPMVSAENLKTLVMGEGLPIDTVGGSPEQAKERAADFARFIVTCALNSLFRSWAVSEDNRVNWLNERRAGLTAEKEAENEKQQSQRAALNVVDKAVARPKIKALNDTRSMLDILAEEQAKKSS